MHMQKRESTHTPLQFPFYLSSHVPATDMFSFKEILRYPLDDNKDKDGSYFLEVTKET